MLKKYDQTACRQGLMRARLRCIFGLLLLCFGGIITLISIVTVSARYHFEKSSRPKRGRISKTGKQGTSMHELEENRVGKHLRVGESMVAEKQGSAEQPDAMKKLLYMYYRKHSAETDTNANVPHDGSEKKNKIGTKVDPPLSSIWGENKDFKTQQGPPHITERQQKVREAMKVGPIRLQQSSHPSLTLSLVHSPSAALGCLLLSLFVCLSVCLFVCSCVCMHVCPCALQWAWKGYKDYAWGLYVRTHSHWPSHWPSHCLRIGQIVALISR